MGITPRGPGPRARTVDKIEIACAITGSTVVGATIVETQTLVGARAVTSVTKRIHARIRRLTFKLQMKTFNLILSLGRESLSIPLTVCVSVWLSVAL